MIQASAGGTFRYLGTSGKLQDPQLSTYRESFRARASDSFIITPATQLSHTCHHGARIGAEDGTYTGTKTRLDTEQPDPGLWTHLDIYQEHYQA